MVLNDANATMKFLAQQDAVKLNQFDGTNYTRWKDKMKFLLTTLKVYYVLDPNLQSLPAATPEDTEELKAERKNREEDEVTCRGLILNSLTDRLYDLYSPYQTPKEIWNAVDTKYQNEKKGTDKFLALNYFDFKMTDDKPVMDQVHELQILVSRLKDLEVVIPDALQIGAILSKLPPSWNNYRKKILQQSETLSVENFQTHLQIECETRIRDEKLKINDAAIDAKSKHQVNQLGGKFAKTDSSKNRDKLKAKVNDFKPNSKRDKVCYHCGRKGHFVKECRFKRRGNRPGLNANNASSSNQANLVEDNKDLVAVITEINSVSSGDAAAWFLDSGATIHVCNNRNLFRTYVADDTEVFMGNHVPAKVLGKGTVLLKFTSGQKLTLLDVFHVPDVKRNLLSAGLLVKKRL